MGDLNRRRVGATYELEPLLSDLDWLRSESHFQVPTNCEP